MPRSSRPRKTYRPRGVNLQAHNVAMHGAALLSLDDRTVWAMRLDDAITAVGRGEAAATQWDEIFAAVALAEQLVMDRLAADPGKIVAEAQQACADILHRTGSRAVKSTELAALRALQVDWIMLLGGITHTQKFICEERIAIRRRSPQTIKVPKPCP